MRAKEYIEQNKETLEFANQLSGIISYFAEIRTDYAKTSKAFKSYLSTVEKTQSFLKKRNCNTIVKESYWELMQKELKHAIKNDVSYSYLYMCVSTSEDALANHTESSVIKQVIQSYFEDYPKNYIDDYLVLDTNRNYLEGISDDLTSSEEVLYIFKTAYEIFDRIRVLMYKPIQASFYFKEYQYQSERLRFYILPLVASYLNMYNYDLTEEQTKNKQTISEKLTNYIASTINPQSEIVKAKTYWYYIKNTLKITANNQDKLALLIKEQVKFEQSTETEKEEICIDFGRNCQPIAACRSVALRL